jgi:hypothetical protein
MKRISNIPGRSIINPQSQGQFQTQQISLSNNPSTMFDLWDEYSNGIGGRKPAKDYNRTERGKVKHKYTRRKVVWDQIVKLVNSGLTSDVAIDRIYTNYGNNKTLTEIINLMKKDKRERYVPPALRVGDGDV